MLNSITEKTHPGNIPIVPTSKFQPCFAADPLFCSRPDTDAFVWDLDCPAICMCFCMYINKNRCKLLTCNDFSSCVCGKIGIRTLGTRKGTTVFETAPFDHSGIFPHWSVLFRIAVQSYNFFSYHATLKAFFSSGDAFFIVFSFCSGFYR